jgi:Autotransporter beta-domain
MSVAGTLAPINSGANALTINGNTNSVTLSSAILLGDIGVTGSQNQLLITNATAVSSGVALVDNSHANQLTFASQSITLANAATAGAVVVNGWNQLNFTSNTSATLAGNLVLAGTSSTVFIDSASVLQQSLNNVAITANSVNNAGTIAIGSDQMLTVSGNYAQASTGVLQVGLGSSASSYGKLLVSGGATFASGATLSLAGAPLVSGTRYVLVSATSGVSGSLIASGGVYRNVAYSLVNTGSEIDLVAGAATGSTTPTPFLNAGQANATLNMAQATNQVIRDRMARMDGKAYHGTDQENHAWVAPYAMTAEQSGLGNAAGAYTQRTAGLAMGIDAPINEGDVRVGIALLTQGGNLSGANNATKDKQSNTAYQLGLYAKARLAPSTHLNLLANAGLANASTSRQDTVGNNGLSASAKQRAGFGLLEAQIDHDITVGDNTFSPLAKINYGYAKINGYTESGAGLSNLAVNAQSTRNLIAAAGMQYRFDLDANSKFVARFSLGHDFYAQSSALMATDGAGTTFTTYGVNPGSTVKEAGIGYEVTGASGKQVRLSYDYYGRTGYNNNMINVKLIVPFE